MKTFNLIKIAPRHGCFDDDFTKFSEQLFCRTPGISVEWLLLWLVSIVDSWIFSKFISIYHSKSQKVLGTYVTYVFLARMERGKQKF